MASIAVNPHSNDAALRKSSTTNWATARGGSTASSVISAASATMGPQADNASDFTTYVFDRAILPFDTSAIGGGTVTAATLDLTMTAGDAPGIGTSIYVALVACNLASAPTIATSDWGNIVTGTTLSAGLSYLDSAATGTKTMTLNAAGLAAINGSGYTTFAVLMSNDQGNDASAPSNIASNGYTYVAFYSSTGTTPPLLTVTYTPATPAPPPLSRRDSALLPFYSFPD